jgi:hypothetical protein
MNVNFLKTHLKLTLASYICLSSYFCFMFFKKLNQHIILHIFILVLLAACQNATMKQEISTQDILPMSPQPDVHSFARPAEIASTYL